MARIFPQPPSRLLATGALALLAVSTARAGASLETFVLATNGQSTYSTYRQPDLVYNNFGGFGAGVPFIAHDDPTLLSTVGVAGTYRQTTSPAAPALTDSLATSGTGVSGFGAWTFSGNTAVTAQYGQLKSASHAVHTGNSDNATINAAESYGIMRETLNPTSPTVANGTSGTMKLAVSVNGNLSVTGQGTAGLLLRYNYGSNSNLNNPASYLLETFASIYGNGYQIYGLHSSYGAFTIPPGMTYTIGSLLPSGSPTSITLGGSSVVYATIPVVFGSAMDYEMGIETFVGVGNGNGVMDTDFSHTATISGIQLFDNTGREVTNFNITSGSGTTYNANGVRLTGSADAPEPATLALLAFGATASGAGLLRRWPRSAR